MLHVTPINDIKSHSEESTCHCNPELKMENGEMIMIHNSFDGREVNEAKYFVMSKIEQHAVAVMSDDNGEMVMKKLSISEIVNKFSGEKEKTIVVDINYKTIFTHKNDLSKVYQYVEVSKDYWVVFQYLTGIKRPAIKQL